MSEAARCQHTVSMDEDGVAHKCAMRGKIYVDGMAHLTGRGPMRLCGPHAAVWRGWITSFREAEEGEALVQEVMLR